MSEGYYRVHYQSKRSSIPDEIKSHKELIRYIKNRIKQDDGLWTIKIERRNDYEKLERAELARLKEKYEGK